ncbi:MAG: DEAD/DEAH box helicase [Nanoarchaeota archaeon]
MEAFKKLGLSEELLKAVSDARFTEPTEIQEKAIPLALAGKDVIGSAATGSGKTLAFGASIIQYLPRKKGVQALVLTPTRELAEQVGKSLRAFSKYKPLEVAIVYGGVSMGPQVVALETADTVVGTPGRILDHLRQGTFKLDKIKVLVLDEADRMLDMGFIEDVEAIISQCSKNRQTFLFSATITPDITIMAKKYTRNSEIVSAENYVDPSLLQQVYYDAPQNSKFSILVHLLKNEDVELVMVFCNTRRNTDFVAHNLKRGGIDATAIHGGLTQARRNKIMENFRKGHVVVLVCTDVAARGLDIKGISHVYNYDIPPTSKEYIHRIGRTARAGKEGKAINIVSPRDYENFRSVLKDDSLKITQEKIPDNLKPLIISLQYEKNSDHGRSRRESFGRPRNFGSGSGRGRRFGGERRAFGQSRFGQGAQSAERRPRFEGRGGRPHDGRSDFKRPGFVENKFREENPHGPRRFSDKRRNNRTDSRRNDNRTDNRRHDNRRYNSRR